MKIKVSLLGFCGVYKEVNVFAEARWRLFFRCMGDVGYRPTVWRRVVVVGCSYYGDLICFVVVKFGGKIWMRVLFGWRWRWLCDDGERRSLVMRESIEGEWFLCWMEYGFYGGWRVVWRAVMWDSGDYMEVEEWLKKGGVAVAVEVCVMGGFIFIFVKWGREKWIVWRGSQNSKNV